MQKYTFFSSKRKVEEREKKTVITRTRQKKEISHKNNLFSEMQCMNGKRSETVMQDMNQVMSYFQNNLNFTVISYLRISLI